MMTASVESREHGEGAGDGRNYGDSTLGSSGSWRPGEVASEDISARSRAPGRDFIKLRVST